MLNLAFSDKDFESLRCLMASDQSQDSVAFKLRGASQVALFFSKFDTERSYDKVEFFDKAYRNSKARIPTSH